MMSWTLANWLTLAGIFVAIIVPAILFLLSRVNAMFDRIDAKTDRTNAMIDKTNEKIDTLSAQMSSMGYDLSGRVGRLEGINQAHEDDRTAASYAARSNQS